MYCRFIVDLLKIVLQSVLLFSIVECRLESQGRFPSNIV